MKDLAPRVWSEVPGQIRLGEKTKAHFQTPPSFSTGVSEVVRQVVGYDRGTTLTINLRC